MTLYHLLLHWGHIYTFHWGQHSTVDFPCQRQSSMHPDVGRAEGYGLYIHTINLKELVLTTIIIIHAWHIAWQITLSLHTCTKILPYITSFARTGVYIYSLEPGCPPLCLRIMLCISCVEVIESLVWGYLQGMIYVSNTKIIGICSQWFWLNWAEAHCKGLPCCCCLLQCCFCSLLCHGCPGSDHHLGLHFWNCQPSLSWWLYWLWWLLQHLRLRRRLQWHLQLLWCLRLKPWSNCWHWQNF